MVRRRHAVVLIAALAGLGGCAADGDVGTVTAGARALTSPPQRIVSLAPSLTETLFALGLGERVVGVTRYCANPPEVQSLPQVGGFLDPNFEAIVSLEPDLVVLIPSSEATEDRLESLGVFVLTIDQHDVGSLLQSISTLADVCGVPDDGANLRDRIALQLAAISARVVIAPRPRAVVVVGHDIGGGAVRSVWAAGPDTFYDGVLEIAGGVNAVKAAVVRYPELSREGLAALDADVILDVIAGVEERDLDLTKIRSGWRELVELRAVRDGRVEILEGDVMVVPGPRLPQLVENVARALHPELDWGHD
jgi:iron complex transport system substrate-binding protein